MQHPPSVDDGLKKIDTFLNGKELKHSIHFEDFSPPQSPLGPTGWIGPGHPHPPPNAYFYRISIIGSEYYVDLLVHWLKEKKLHEPDVKGKWIEFLFTPDSYNWKTLNIYKSNHKEIKTIPAHYEKYKHYDSVYSILKNHHPQLTEDKMRTTIDMKWIDIEPKWDNDLLFSIQPRFYLRNVADIIKENISSFSIIELLIWQLYYDVPNDKRVNNPWMGEYHNEERKYVNTDKYIVNFSIPYELLDDTLDILKSLPPYTECGGYCSTTLEEKI